MDDSISFEMTVNETGYGTLQRSAGRAGITSADAGNGLLKTERFMQKDRIRRHN